MKDFYTTKKIPSYISALLEEYTQPMIDLAKTYDMYKSSNFVKDEHDINLLVSEEALIEAKNDHNINMDCFRPKLQDLFDYNNAEIKIQNTNPYAKPTQLFQSFHTFRRKLTMETGMMRDPLSGFYPKNGGLSWHNNADVPGYNILFTYSLNGNGFFRYERDGKIVTIEDQPGWNIKFMYYGNVDEPDDICWHTCASYDDARMTFAFLTQKTVAEEFMYECSVVSY